MKQGLKALALLAAMTLGGAVIAADAPAPGGTEAPKKTARAPGVRGKVTKVENGKITVAARGGAEATVTVDDKTKVTLDGADAKIGDIKEGMFISATPETGTATEVKAMTKAPQRKPKPAPDAPKAPEAPAK